MVLVVLHVAFQKQQTLFAGKVYLCLVVLDVLLHLNCDVLEPFQQICYLAGQRAGEWSRWGCVCVCACACVRACVCVCVCVDPCVPTHGLTTGAAALNPRSFWPEWTNFTASRRANGKWTGP